TQRPGVDFHDTHSPVARFESFRLVFSLAAKENWLLEQIDVKSAYLNGKLDEEIFMRQPEGFQVLGKEDWLLRLLKSLYGLKQSG
ncbi:hypothetical protein HETIRDRAFT_248012, partial [Heterobasidion irregulare TC 32-1]